MQFSPFCVLHSKDKEIDIIYYKNWVNNYQHFCLFKGNSKKMLEKFKVISHFFARDKYTNPIFSNNLILRHIHHDRPMDPHKVLDLS